MGKWLKRKHECSLPNSANKGIGSVWQCKCGKRYQITLKESRGFYVTTSWREVGEDESV